MDIKVNAQGSCVSKPWDEYGKNRICRIFITTDSNGINSIQFGYVEDGNDKSIVLSNRFGGECYEKIFTVTLNYPVEYITIVRGTYGPSDDDHDYIVSSLTVCTNLGTYGPFGRIAGESFIIEMGADFFGFHGYRNRKYLRAIGVYIKPLASVMDRAVLRTTTTHDHLVQSAVKEE
ncbi:inactive protein RESTRICTED TEV MOVEMENT 1-like [Thalictrum thalictroides]|uniref:Inactive protein RESTRICTED TEV MOVEMENT 1-like n=1 Tax=Thalictrum thalictroides TaxID=46969 RepID=A0A7J6W478_THATH|nr:inactive protein RESTRICTED TEV MOVEMENT 1-like [Thalictrum thalictroides]